LLAKVYTPSVSAEPVLGCFLVSESALGFSRFLKRLKKVGFGSVWLKMAPFMQFFGLVASLAIEWSPINLIPSFNTNPNLVKHQHLQKTLWQKTLMQKH
jgi:hypothetical protein